MKRSDEWSIGLECVSIVVEITSWSIVLMYVLSIEQNKPNSLMMKKRSEEMFKFFRNPQPLSQGTLIVEQMRMWTRYYKAYDDDKIKIGEISEELRNALDIFFFVKIKRNWWFLNELYASSATSLLHILRECTNMDILLAIWQSIVTHYQILEHNWV